MRSDYLLYGLAVVFFAMTAASLILVTEQLQKSLWLVSTVVLGLFSAGLGYTQRPKTKAVVTPPVVPVESVLAPQTEVTPVVVKNPVAASVGSQAEMPAATERIETVEPPKNIEAMPAPTVSSAPEKSMRDLTQVKGIGEKRATQLKALGINGVEDLAKISVSNVATSLKISPKIVEKWVAAAKELTK
jgi:predicted flap endonuclease-1-like 5' DNA nuclease